MFWLDFNSIKDKMHYYFYWPIKRLNAVIVFKWHKQAFCYYALIFLFLFFIQTLRRLAQNREAARKSRLRKMVRPFLLIVDELGKLLWYNLVSCSICHIIETQQLVMFYKYFWTSFLNPCFYLFRHMCNN